MRGVKRGKRLVLSLAMTAATGAAVTSCVSSNTTAKYGMQEGHTSYVPARIAILGCQAWPEGARFNKLPLSSVKAPELRDLCEAADKFLLSGFQGQPYMKGYSPKFVQQGVDESGDDELLGKLPGLWVHRGSDNQDAANAPTFYSSTIASRPEWLTWLNTVSTDVHNADAVFIPFITYAYERNYDDRGMQTAERAAGVAVLLIDTNNGALLWAGGRDAIASKKRLNNGNVPAALPYPPWSEVKERLFVEDLWKDFPGRQIF